jgi:hypothetical protein
VISLGRGSDKTPEAFANVSPGFERSENTGYEIINCDKTLKGFGGWRTLSGFRPWLCVGLVVESRASLECGALAPLLRKSADKSAHSKETPEP